MRSTAPSRARSRARQLAVPLAVPFVLALLACAPARAADPVPRSAADQQIAARISADSLRGHLSFLASDLLEGRATPSRGQDLAAEYIAAQFRRAGLEPAGDDGYFQTSTWTYAERDMSRFVFTVSADYRKIRVPTSAVDLRMQDGLELKDATVVAMPWDEAMANPARADGKVLVLTLPQDRRAAYGGLQKFSGKPALLILVDGSRKQGSGVDGWLVPQEGAKPQAGPPTLVLYDAPLEQTLRAAGTGVTLSVPPPTTRQVKLRNVAGVLRGSDPKLKDTYVILSAHYDHLGVRNGDIYNGANDDGSGTVSVIEIASSLAAQKPRPKRSIVFMTFFGEELGLFGSRYYGQHPLFPFKDTVAGLNLEQVGRTDDSEGPHVNMANLTGFDYSTVAATLQRAGDQVGVRLVKHPQASDAYFGRSDNQSLADAGVPAHTLSVAYEYPDYHGKDDKWPKVDYDNMARVDRMVALGLFDIANDPQTPHWTAVPKAAPYRDAAAKLK